MAPFVMLAWLHVTAADRMVDQPGDLGELSAACVMGARVYGPGEPSPVAQQRVEAAAVLALSQPKLTFVVSGDEHNEREASELATLLDDLVQAPITIEIDADGDSTHRNVLALRPYGDGPVVFVTQGYHLPRTLWMARQEGLDAWGLRAEEVAPVPPGVGPIERSYIRSKRHLREAVLALLHLLGLYDRLAGQA